MHRPLRFVLLSCLCVLLFATFLALDWRHLEASSHREAPLISNDPLADNTDVYAFRSPDEDETITIIANYIPLELPSGGPNYYTFGENIRYEIHIKNQPSMGALGTATDDITYRFTFNRVNEDPTTFFNIRLGLQNLKTTYTLEKKVGAGAFTPIISNGTVPPNNIGPRSINDATLGLGATYDQLAQNAILTASTGEKVFAGPRDDPFFVDLGGIFDVGAVRDMFGNDPANPAFARDDVAGFNTHSLALQIPIEMLQKDGKTVDQATDILDPDFVIGVWASASRPAMRTLNGDGTETHAGSFVQVSRLGMPLVNEVIIPLGGKDIWNAVTPYDVAEQNFVTHFTNPELGLYMSSSLFGSAVPGLNSRLMIPTNAYPSIGDPDSDGENGFDFTLGRDGLFDLIEGSVDLTGTAFTVPLQPTGTGSTTALLGNDEPRRADLFPLFYFGVPNLPPYQLATGKTSGPLSAGKPFINNFLPITQDGVNLYGGDMLRLNMATPPTDRASTEFQNNAYKGLIRAADLGLTTAPFNTNTNLESIPHMDGFPNGRRLEDDVTTIELQAIGGIVLAAVGLPFDDATQADYSDLASPNLLDALTFVAGPTKNDVPLLSSFPYLGTPQRGFDSVRDVTAEDPTGTTIPVELAGLRGVIDQQAAVLTWRTASETNNAGFEVQMRRKVPAILGALAPDFETLGFVEGRGTTTAEQTYRFRTDVLDPGTYRFRLRQIDFDGQAEYSAPVELEVTLPGSYHLTSAYPNPFNPQTQFSLTLAGAQPVKVEVFDVAGRRLKVLHDGELSANVAHRFRLEASDLASGLYIIRARGKTFTATRRVTLVK